jgi:hypothetical protein
METTIIRTCRISQYPVVCPTSIDCFGLTDLYILRIVETFGGKTALACALPMTTFEKCLWYKRPSIWVMYELS